MINLHYYHVLDEDFVHKVISMYSESGVFLKSFDLLKKNCINTFRQGNRLYHTAKEYVDDVVSFDNLGIGNFNGIFKVYFLFCSIVFIVFLIHLTINFILSREERIRSWETGLRIYLNFQRFVNIKNRIVSYFNRT